VRKRLEMGGEVRRSTIFTGEPSAGSPRRFEAFSRGVDAIFAPTAPIAALPLAQNVVKNRLEEETVRCALLRLNRTANFV